MKDRHQTDAFRFGTCTVPDGEMGPWKISTFTLTEDDVAFSNLRAAMRGNRLEYVSPGTYRKLTHSARGVVMSNTQMEISTNYGAYLSSRGRVLINGLGLGMLLEGILSKRDDCGEHVVSYVRVIEVDADVISLVGPHFAGDSRVEIIHADALSYSPPRSEPPFDFAWHDIWDAICADNLPDMSALGRKWNKRRAHSQDWWVRDECRRLA